MKLRILLEPSDEGGYTAIVPALPGCVSEGNTREEAVANVQEQSSFISNPLKTTLISIPKRNCLTSRCDQFLDQLEATDGDQPLTLGEDLQVFREAGLTHISVFWSEYREIVVGGST